MLDLYWQFAAWAEKPYVLTNWISLLLLLLVSVVVRQHLKTQHEIHALLAKIHNLLVDQNEKS